MAFKPKYLDYDLSPYTGMTRKSWIDAAEYLLEGIFRHIPSGSSPVIVPRSETEITYPHKNSPGNRLKIEEMAQRFEGLARSFFIAAPIIHIDPDTEISGYNLRDYYSCWAFNVYAPIWNKWYGYDNEPYIAERFEEHANKLMETYPDFFDKDGFTNMWGRSGVYRNAATSPLAENFVLKNPKADAGLARRIASGSLLQFFTRDDFLIDGIPTMGFYRQFAPLIQGYSCAESAYWLGKTFLCLSLPETHPFWTATENNGSWDKLSGKQIKETTLNAPALCFTNHNANGETILRTGKVIKHSGDEHGMWNYSKLAYNSKYPWESSPSNNIESMQYVLINGDSPCRLKCNATLWHGSKSGVLYRRQFFNYNLKNETHWMQAINLADFPVEYGIIRADKLRLYCEPIKLTLGAYGFPDNGTEIVKKSSDTAKAIILKGYDHTGQEKQLAMTIYDGWDDIDFIHSIKTNPDSERSVIAYATTSRHKLYGNDRFILISQVITKESHEDFTDEEVFPINEIIYTDKKKSGGYGSITIRLIEMSKMRFS